ncbi:MAG: DUF1705 domain-containing protein, partial [Acinetobacter sp.]
MLDAILQFRNKIHPISLNQFNLVLAIWLGVVLNLSFFQQIHHLTPYQGMKAYLFLAATAVVIIAAYYFIFQLLNWKWTAKPITIALLFIGGFASYAVTSLGVLITPDQIQNLMQTDASEARDTWSWHLVLWTFGMIVLPIIVALMVKIKPEPIVRQLWTKTLASVLSLAMIGGLLFVFYVDFAAIFREHRD